MRNSVHLLKESFSESTLFSFQDMMLAKGIHYCHAASLWVAREMLYSFLRLSFPYKNVGYMGVIPANFTECAQDIYGQLIDGGFCDNTQRVSKSCCNGARDRHALDSFIYDQCLYDFIWIEKNIDAHNFLVESFEHMVITHNLENSIPIVTLYYRT